MNKQILLFMGLFALMNSSGVAFPGRNVFDWVEMLPSKVWTIEEESVFDKETDRFLKAKESVFRRDWIKAKEHLDGYLEAYPKGHFRDEALYWLAQSLDKLACDETEVNKVITFKTEAVKKLDLLMQQFPESLWIDDAQDLKVDIASALVLMDKIKPETIIENILSTKIKNSMDLKMVGLNALLELETEVALPILLRIIKTEEKPAVRKKAVSMLGRHYSEEALLFLNRVVENDPDASVKEEASFWLNKIKMDLIPVQLIYFVYSAELTEPEESNRITEKEVNVFDIPRIKSQNKNKVVKAIQRFFNNQVAQIKFASNGIVGLYFDYFGMRISHNIHRFNIQMLEDGFVKEYDQISGKVRFYDLERKKEYLAAYTVDNMNDKLLAMRRGDKVALVVMQFESHGESDAEKMESDEPIYHTEFNNVLGCTVLSNRKSWSMDEMTTEKRVTDFGRAKAKIPGENGRWTLIGNILLHRKERRFVGRKATLFDPTGKTVVEAAQITVTVDNPEKYEVIRKKGK